MNIIQIRVVTNIVIPSMLTTTDMSSRHSSVTDPNNNEMETIMIECILYQNNSKFYVEVQSKQRYLSCKIVKECH